MLQMVHFQLELVLAFVLHYYNTVETGCYALFAVKRIVLCELYCSLLGAYAQQAT